MQKIISMDVDQVKRYLRNVSNESKIYIGADSERFLKNGMWIADVATVIVIHIDGNKGCKIFGEIVRDRDYDYKPNKPSTRLMKEVMMVSDLYSRIKDEIQGKHFEIHLDINPSPKYSSNIILSQAIGYIVGTCFVKPKIKPYAFAASIAADRFKDL